ncbi:fibronectin type III domain-containing protein [Streptomyces sp. NBC_01304]|uniref:fibronectin type III domain-containing protein n=1 Tax=Streptomyces sp. NBC_01304 TaxID=2903818 RepID=UPI002E122B52|nr:fibronectin type III domain-containing protein [Streptomyces sp. NBC_01304]
MAEELPNEPKLPAKGDKDWDSTLNAYLTWLTGLAKAAATQTDMDNVLARLHGIENYAGAPRKLDIARLELNKTSATAFTAVWNITSGADPKKGDSGYKITVTPAGPKVEKVTKKDSATVQAAVTGCTSGTEYTFTVSSFGTPPNFTDSDPVHKTITPA